MDPLRQSVQKLETILLDPIATDSPLPHPPPPRPTPTYLIFSLQMIIPLPHCRYELSLINAKGGVGGVSVGSSDISIDAGDEGNR